MGQAISVHVVWIPAAFGGAPMLPSPPIETEIYWQLDLFFANIFTIGDRVLDGTTAINRVRWEQIAFDPLGRDGIAHGVLMDDRPFPQSHREPLGAKGSFKDRCIALVDGNTLLALGVVLVD